MKDFADFAGGLVVGEVADRRFSPRAWLSPTSSSMAELIALRMQVDTYEVQRGLGGPRKFQSDLNELKRSWMFIIYLLCLEDMVHLH